MCSGVEYECGGGDDDYACDDCDLMMSVPTVVMILMAISAVMVLMTAVTVVTSAMMSVVLVFC
jgi:hypothetical protein